MTAPANPAGHAAAGRWFVIGAAFFWGTSATLARFVFRDHHVPPLTVVELRLAIAALMLGTWLAIRRRDLLRIDRRDIGYFVLLGVFGLAAVQGSYYYSISVLGVGLAILIQYLAPTLILILQIARGAKPGRVTLLAAIGALIGTAMLVGDVGPEARSAAPWQWAISFCSALIFAFYILYSKRGLARYALETVLFYTLCVAAVFWAFVTPPWTLTQRGFGADLWWMFFALAIFSTLVPFSLFYAGLRRLPPAEAGIIATLEPVVAVVSAALLLGEGLGPIQTVGAGLVLVASVVSNRAGAREPQRKASAGADERTRR